MEYQVNKEKCVGCQACLANCPGATKIDESGKAEVIDQEKLEKCGGESVCPFGAIEKVSERKEPEGKTFPTPPYGPPFPGRRMGPGMGRGFGRGRGWGRGLGRGMGRGMGRGLGIGPRDGRGRGRGGGGRGY